MIVSECRSWHRLGVRCGCGYLAIPARFYERNDKTGVEMGQDRAEANYLVWLGSAERPGYVNPAVMAEMSPQDVSIAIVPAEMSPLCPRCSKRPVEAGRAMCSACRKAAYRGRRG